MKKNKLLFIIINILSLNIFIVSIANSVDCAPAWDGNWTTTESCNFPNSWQWISNAGFKVNWDIYVKDHTITFPFGTRLNLKLSTYKITFTSWINSKMMLHPSTAIWLASHSTYQYRYYISVPYSNTGSTECPPWMFVFNVDSGSPPVYNVSTFNNSNAYLGATARIVSPTWTMYCWTKWT